MPDELTDGLGNEDPGLAGVPLGRLLQERLLRAGTGGMENIPADRVLTWCLPWDEAVSGAAPLAGILVYAQGGQVSPAGLEALERRGAEALAVAGPYVRDGASSLPVLHVSEGVSFRDLSRLVGELALARETHVIRYGLSVHHSLVELLYRGAGLDALCFQMARLSAAAAAILDIQFRVLAFDPGPDRDLDPDTVAAALRSTLTPPADVERRHGAQVTAWAGPGAAPLTLVTSPIVLAGRHDGWVAVIGTDQPPHPHDLSEHRVVAEQSATIVGTEMLRMRSIEQAEERARGDFVQALLHGRFTTAREMEARAAHYEFAVSADYGVIVAGGLPGPGALESLSAPPQYAAAAVRLASAGGPHTLATMIGGVLAVVREIPSAAGSPGPEAGDRALGEYAVALRKDLTRRVGRPVTVAWGRMVHGADKIFDSYRDARLALELCGRLGIQDARGFSGMRVFATLAELADSEKARSFAADLLAPLRDQHAGVADLEKSVIAYVRSGGNINAAARELHIHRNTMLYRLDRASRLLSLDLREAEHQFAVWLACKLDLLFETERTVAKDVSPG
jgi:DNA-binding PucR family transcriptional regulator